MYWHWENDSQTLLPIKKLKDHVTKELHVWLYLLEVSGLNIIGQICRQCEEYFFSN